MARDCVVKITSQGIYFNKDLLIKVNATNLPLDTLAIQAQRDIYWLVEQIAFDKSKNLLKVVVKDYFYQPAENEFHDQTPKSPIEKVFFEQLREVKVLQQAVNYYQRFVNNRLVSASNINLDRIDESYASERDQAQDLQLTFTVHFKDAHFRNGFIVFERYIPEIDKALIFEVENNNILAEYEYVKSYFGKVFKKKKFKVFATITYNQKGEAQVKCHSPELARIDQQMIESIKQLRTRDIIKSQQINDPDKSLFTADDVFDTLNEARENYGNIFSQTEEDIMYFLMNFKKVRNRKQLEYLAGKLQSDKMKLKFTMYPHFGFLFLIEGKEMNHFCWELLNSHATYLWSIDKSTKLPLQINRIERIINTIRTSGRQQYRMAYQHNVPDDDIIFSVINH
ncbi:MAG: hypothetical protein ACOCWM_02745, partial [Cyclobacteriaceae bacterium]